VHLPSTKSERTPLGANPRIDYDKVDGASRIGTDGIPEREGSVAYILGRNRMGNVN
jgi:hypothetical protein